MSDAELLDLLRASPNEGLRLLVRQYEGLLFSVIRGVLKSAPEADIEECVSDVFADFYFALDRCDLSAGSVKAYLCVAAKHKALNVLRTTARRREDDPENPVEPVAPEGSAEDVWLDAAQRRELARAVRALGRPDSEIIFRKFYLGQSAQEIGAALKMSAGNVDVRTHRALKKLRKRWER